MTAEVVPFASITLLSPGQPITFESRFGSLVGVVGEISDGEYIGIQNIKGEWRITPDHLAEGRLVAEFPHDADEQAAEPSQEVNLVVVPFTHGYGRRFPIRPSSWDLVSTEAAEKYLEAHPAISENAPSWARAIEFTEIFDDGEAAFFYVYDDEKFEVLESWYVETDGTLTYGHNDGNEPEISCKEDALLELVTEYIEARRTD